MENRLNINEPLLALVRQFKQALPGYKAPASKPLIKYTIFPNGVKVYNNHLSKI